MGHSEWTLIIADNDARVYDIERVSVSRARVLRTHCIGYCVHSACGVRVALGAASSHPDRVQISARATTQQTGSMYFRILQERNMRRVGQAENSPSSAVKRTLRIDKHGRNVGPTVRSMALFIALFVAASVTAISLAVSLDRLDEQPPQSVPEETVTSLPVNIQLAQALSHAINAGDVDEVVELFTEEDAGPTVLADRFAWEKFEIRLWASHEAAMNMHMDTVGYQLTEHGATWHATAYRDDWSAVGVHGLSVTNSIWVQDAKIASFTSVPRNVTDVQQLGNMWRPGATPEH